jgi:outer membrane protein TolC
MKITAYKKLLIILIALCSWVTGHSQQYSDSLFNYLEIAAKNNPTVQQKFSEYQAALQKMPQVGSLSDPELSLGVFLKPMELVNGNQLADIRLMQMFPWFGVLKNAKNEMSMMANAKFELFRDAKLQVFYDVQRTWYDLYKIQKSISISEKNIEILKIIERIAVVRFKSASSGSTGAKYSGSGMSAGSNQTISAGSSGMQSMGAVQGSTGLSSSNPSAVSMQAGSMSSSTESPGLADLYRIQIEAGDLENNIALLKSRRNSILAQFNSYLNRPAATMVSIPETISPDSYGLSLIAVSDSILANNPMLDMLDFEKQSIEARKKMVSRMGYPMIGLGLNYMPISKNEMSASAMNGKDMIMPMVTVTLPVYRKKYNAMIKEADLLKIATSQNYQATYNSLQNEYYQAVQVFQDSERRVKLYANQYQLASKSFDLILKSFSTSSAGLTDLLRVRQQTLDYELKEVEAVADFNTAVSWLNRLMAFSQTE